MKQTTAAVIMVLISALVTLYAIYVTRCGWWISAYCVAVLISCGCQPENNSK